MAGNQCSSVIDPDMSGWAFYIQLQMRKRELRIQPEAETKLALASLGSVVQTCLLGTLGNVVQQCVQENKEVESSGYIALSL